MVNKTQYREVSNGYYNYLQYRKKKRFLFIPYYGWCYIWKPYYDHISGRGLVPDHLLVINSLSTNLENFVEIYPDIDEYFKWAKEKQAILEKEVRTKIIEINKKRKNIKYF